MRLASLAVSEAVLGHDGDLMEPGWNRWMLDTSDVDVRTPDDLYPITRPIGFPAVAENVSLDAFIFSPAHPLLPALNTIHSPSLRT